MWTLGTNKLDWEPGHLGKGVVDHEWGVHTWNEDDHELHDDYLQEHPEILPISYFYIGQDGAIDISMPSNLYDTGGAHERFMEHICDADPHFHADNQAAWDF